MKFAEFQPGQEIEAGPYRSARKRCCALPAPTIRSGFTPMPPRPRRGRFGGLIASGWHTCAIAMRLVADAALQGSESFASPGLAYVKWPHPVRPGDALMLRATVLETRRSRQHAHLGILRWRWQLSKAGGVEVLDLEATSLFDLT